MLGMMLCETCGAVVAATWRWGWPSAGNADDPAAVTRDDLRGPQALQAI